jgi:hypothetical protein
MFTQIKRIKEVDTTAEQAIASYGSFVYETTKSRAARSSRRGWAPDTVLLSKASAAVPVIHKAIADKFGQDAVYQAINAHPFA